MKKSSRFVFERFKRLNQRCGRVSVAGISFRKKKFGSPGVATDNGRRSQAARRSSRKFSEEFLPRGKPDAK